MGSAQNGRRHPAPEVDRVSRQARRDRYEAILRVVDYQTGGPDTALPAGVRATTIGQNRTHAGEDWQDVESALQAAVEHDDLLRYRDRDGHVRYTRRTVDGLQALVATEAQHEHPDQDLIARCNRILQALRRDS